MGGEELKPPSAKSMPTGMRTHDCYEHFEQVKDEKLFKCDGCKVDDMGPRYICTICDNEIHKACAYPKPTISHDYFGCSVFNFAEFPSIVLDNNKQKVFGKHCVACDKKICGFSYHCEAKDLSLHPSCYKLEKKVLIDDTIFDLKPKPPSGCEWCGYDNVLMKGWSYVSSCNNFHFHVDCLVEMVHEANMKHTGKIDLNNLVKPKNNGTSSEEIRGVLSGISDTYLQTLKTAEKVKLFFEILIQQFVENGKLALKKVFKAAKAFGIKIKVNLYDKMKNFMKEKAHKMARKVLVSEMLRLYQSSASA